jgi:hypothetical protein
LFVQRGLPQLVPLQLELPRKKEISVKWQVEVKQGREKEKKGENLVR